MSHGDYVALLQRVDELILFQQYIAARRGSPQLIIAWNHMCRN
jgi:hypothetical protein